MDDIFNPDFHRHLFEWVSWFIQISNFLFVPEDLFDNESSIVQGMAWYWQSENESSMVQVMGWYWNCECKLPEQNF